MGSTFPSERFKAPMAIIIFIVVIVFRICDTRNAKKTTETMAVIPKEVLDDLCSRFLINLPQEEKDDPVRACFQIELAHWMYLDLCRAENRDYPNCGLRDFIKQMFRHCPFLTQHADDVDIVVAKWREYKSAVPTYGAILLDESMENVLLVQGFYARTSWGFPKGKVNEEELPHKCAIREVLEETGFDIGSLIDENEYLERTLSETPHRLYLVGGVPRSFEFKPTTRNEIKECRWFALRDLPASRVDRTKADIGMLPNNFFMVFPFVEQIKTWVQDRRSGRHMANGVLAALFPNLNGHRSPISASQKFNQQRQNGNGGPENHRSPHAKTRGQNARFRSFSHSSSSPAVSAIFERNEKTPRQKQQRKNSSSTSKQRNEQSPACNGISTPGKGYSLEIRPANAWQNLRLDLTPILEKL